jgi:hypothetical protein
MNGEKNATAYLFNIIKERLACDENDTIMTQDGELAYDC